MVQVNSYLIWDETNLACIIDPGFSNIQEEMSLIDFLDKEGLQLSRCIATHKHFDHVLGAKFIKEHFGVDIEIPKGEIMGFPDVDSQLVAFGIPASGGKYDFIPKELSSSVTIGNTTLEVISTPGHSPAHVSFYEKDSGVLFCGDVIFRGGHGRYDLWGSSYDELMKSIDTLLRLPANTLVLSGHGAETTIGVERK